jgi:hypothetical protein
MYTDSTSWYDDFKITYTYDSNNKVIVGIQYYWFFGSWIPNIRYNYSYDANNNLICINEQNWEGTGWMNRSNYINTYDAKNKKSISYYQWWDGAQWINDQQYIYTYDSYDNLTVLLLKQKVDTLWRNFEKDAYYYHEITGIDKQIPQETEIKIYPNPSNGKFSIQIPEAANDLKIYSLIGELVYSNPDLKQNSTQEINLTSLKKGIYFVKIQSNSKIYTSKIVIQ